MYDEEALKREFGRSLNRYLRKAYIDVQNKEVPFENQLNDSVIIVNRNLLLEYINSQIKGAFEEGIRFAYDNKIINEEK